MITTNLILEPEAHHPVAIEQAYATARWIVAQGAEKGLDANRLASRPTRSAAT